MTRRPSVALRFAVIFLALAIASDASAAGELFFNGVTEPDGVSEVVYSSPCAGLLPGGVHIDESNAFVMSDGGRLKLDTRDAGSNVVAAIYRVSGIVDPLLPWVFEARVKELPTAGPSPREGFGIAVADGERLFRLTFGNGEAFGSSAIPTSVAPTEDDFHTYTMTYTPGDPTYSALKDGSIIPISDGPQNPSGQNFVQFGDPTCHGNNGGYLIEYVKFIQLEPANEAPTAGTGGPISAHPGQTVVLDGTASFDDNTDTNDLGYDWVLSSAPAGSTATLNGSDTSEPSLTPDLPGTYVATLTVTDEGGLVSVPSDQEVSSNNLAPTASIIANTLVVTGTSVSIDGSGSSDPENDPLTYAWSLQVPMGSLSVPMNPTAAITSFSPDLDGVYDVQLIVDDGIGPSAAQVLAIVSTDVGSFAEANILEASSALTNLPTSAVTTKGNRNALLNFMAQAASALQIGDTAEAIDKVQDAIARTDGCSKTSASPDGNGPGRDWVSTCEAQASIYPPLVAALGALLP